MTLKKSLSILDRYLMATLGMFLAAIGIAMTIVSNLGTSPLSCPSYVLNLRFPSISVGMFTLIVNCCFVLLQIALLRKDFKPKFLLQILASAIFGYMIDVSLVWISWLQPQMLASRLLITVASCFVSALGVSLELVADAWMLSAEMTAYALAKRSGKPFNTMKVAMDCTVVIVSVLAALLFFGNPLGNGDSVVIGLGTVICAVLIGLVMKFTDPLARKIAR